MAQTPSRGGDEFHSSSVGSDTPSTDRERGAWEGHADGRDEFRAKTRPCLGLLDQAAPHERNYRQLKRQAEERRGPAGIQIYEQAQDENRIAARLQAQFLECVATRGRGSDSGTNNTSFYSRDQFKGGNPPNGARLAQAPSSSDEPRPCTPPADPATTARLRKTGIEIVDLTAAMGQQVDRMLDAMGRSVTTQLAYLAQPNAKIWEDRKLIGRAIVTYMSNEDARRHLDLRRLAEAEAQAIARDPSSALGSGVGEILFGRAVAMSGAACRVTATRLAAGAMTRANVEKAANRLKVMLETEKQQLSGPGNLCSAASNRVNPQGRRNACVPASWADELTDETGFDWTESHFRWTQQDDVTPWTRIYAVQKQQWGDRRYYGHDPTRSMLQSEGMPALMRGGAQEIVNELKRAGRGASGLVTIFRQDGSAHMFRAKNIDGTVKFRDPLLDTGGSFNFMPEFNNGPLRQIMFFRTSGADRILPP